MSAKSKKLREKRAKLITDSRTLLDQAENENRQMTDEERTNYDRMFDEQGKLKDAIEIEERQDALDREAAALNAPSNDPDSPEPRDNPGAPLNRRATPEYRAMFNQFIIAGLPGLKPEHTRALEADTDISGGFLVAPEQFVAQLIKKIDDLVFVRGNATVIPVGSAASLGIPTLDTDPADADWTSELATGNEDSAMAFGKRALTPHPLAKRIKISNKLLRNSAIPAEQLTRDRLAYKFAITQEKAYITGNGSQQPLGVFTASANGISTARDISTDNTTTSMTVDGLINAKYSLKAGYWMRSRWMFHRDGVKQVAKLKDGNGQYLWRESVREGEPDRLLGRPVDMSEYAPNTFTTGLYVGMLADWSNYWIVDSLQFQLQRLMELYAATNQIGLIGRYEGDGMPVLEEAFARVTLA